MSQDYRSRQPQPERSRFKWVLIAFLLIAGYFLITEHRAHVIEYLPLALLFGCLFLHGFMHGGHGKHGERGEHGESRPDDKPKGGRQ